LSSHNPRGPESGGDKSDKNDQSEKGEKGEKNDSAPDEDVALMLALAGGDDAAFDVLFSRWGSRLLGYLQRMVGDAATAEELVQEAFLRVYRARDSYHAESRFSTWLYRIATNLALNELRRPRRRRPHASTDDEAAPLALVDRKPDPEAAAHARLVLNELEAALFELPDRQRMALWLATVAGQSYAEVARALGTSEKSVKSLVHRARSTLAARLAASRGSAPHQQSRKAGGGG
jgi:RNA polymerase sigma-70 factor (ECF subfamily)